MAALDHTASPLAMPTTLKGPAAGAGTCLGAVIAAGAQAARDHAVAQARMGLYACRLVRLGVSAAGVEAAATAAPAQRSARQRSLDRRRGGTLTAAADPLRSAQRGPQADRGSLPPPADTTLRCGHGMAVLLAGAWRAHLSCRRGR